jgi:hypothetical protein
MESDWQLLYASELSVPCASLASRRLLEHLTRWQVPFKQIVLSTDSGSESGATERHERPSGYPTLVRCFHRFIADEFFDLELFPTRGDFFEKIRTDQLWWNFARPNDSKGKAPSLKSSKPKGSTPPSSSCPPPISINSSRTPDSSPGGAGSTC